MDYNSFNYSLRVWLTSSLVVPHLYLLYYVLDNGTGSYIPFLAYIELVLESVAFSLPVWFVFMMALDIICKTNLSSIVKKIFAAAILEALLLLMFAVIIHAFGSRTLSWSSTMDFVVISSFTMQACVFLYKLRPVARRKNDLQI